MTLRFLLSPLAVFYASLIFLRNCLYDLNLLKSFAVDVPVVSIGNLTAGGTGKTPLVHLFARELSSRGMRLAIVSRGYKGKFTGNCRVQSDRADLYGDEPAMLAALLPQVPVYVGRDRVEACNFLLKEQQIDLIIADDAFQHRRLRRAYNIVVFDATAENWQYASLPQGRRRESWSSLRRADAIVVNKVNLAPVEAVQFLEKKFGTYVKLRTPVLRCEYRISRIVSLHTREVISEDKMRGAQVTLMAGIAHPENFFRLLKDTFQLNVVSEMGLVDHHIYSEKDLKFFEEEANRLDSRVYVVTNKDAVKLQAWQPKNLEVWVAELECVPDVKIAGIYEALLGLLS